MKIGNFMIRESQAGSRNLEFLDFLSIYLRKKYIKYFLLLLFSLIILKIISNLNNLNLILKFLY